MREQLSVAQFAERTCRTEAAVRMLLQRRHDNGMLAAGVVVKLGRRVLIDTEAYQRWLDAQQPQQDRAA